MYLDFYGLSGEPFRLTPDARFFYESRTHRKAMAYLTYGLGKAEGFVVMTGEIGAGKTTLLEHLRSTLIDPRIAAGWIVTSQVEADDLLRLVATAFGLTASETDKGSLIRRIEAFLIRCREQDQRACLIVDEAQSLSLSSLEELRMLSNLHGTGSALLQILLVGQPDFRAVLQSPHLEQLRQRIIVSCHLPALDDDETRAYIEHRLHCVNWRGDPELTEAAFHRIHAVTGGLPRRINLLCDRLLLHAFLDNKHQLEDADVRFVVADYQGEITGVTPAAAAEQAAPGIVPPDAAVRLDTARETAWASSAVMAPAAVSITPPPPFAAAPFAAAAPVFSLTAVGDETVAAARHDDHGGTLFAVPAAPPVASAADHPPVRSVANALPAAGHPLPAAADTAGVPPPLSPRPRASGPWEAAASLRHILRQGRPPSTALPGPLPVWLLLAAGALAALVVLILVVSLLSADRLPANGGVAAPVVEPSASGPNHR